MLVDANSEPRVKQRESITLKRGNAAVLVRVCSEQGPSHDRNTQRLKIGQWSLRGHTPGGGLPVSP